MTQEQINNIPQELKDRPRWVGFMLWWNAEKGKNDKIPINPHSFWGAGSTRPDSWGSFDDALRAVGHEAKSHRRLKKADDVEENTVITGKVDGVGFVLGDGICGIDLDHCIGEAGELSDQAQDIVGMMDGTYLEYSPSGTGIHMLFRGRIPTGRCKSKDNTVEMYSAGRFFTVTANGAGDLEERTDQAAMVFQKYMAPQTREAQRPAPPARAVDLPLEADDVLLEKMFRAKNGDTVSALWNGDTGAYGGDDSRADSALVMHLLFWTHGDVGRTDSLFRRSGLMRSKWDEKHGSQTYGELTIQKAIDAQKSYAVQRDFAPVIADQRERQGFVSNGGPGKGLKASDSGVVVIDPLSDERRYDWNDMGVGALFADTYRNVARYVSEAESWYVYDGAAWRLDAGGLRVAEYAKALVRHMISCAAGISDDEKRGKFMQFLAKMNSNKARNAMLESAKSIYPISMHVFDRDPYLFNCRNGTLNLRTFELQPPRPADFLSKIAAVDYLPGATCSRWDDFIDEIMENDHEKAEYLQSAIGYALTGLQNQKCFFILHGQKTNNGKSTFMDAIMSVMGDYAKAAQADVITSKQYTRDSSAPSEDIARLWGARLVSMAEPDKSARLNVGLIKQMTGNDPLTARFLRQNSFQFKPEFKIFLHANDLPQTTDDTIFSSGRVKVIVFGREFTQEEQDKTLATDFQIPENAAGILNWMVEGARMFLSKGLMDPIAVQAAVAAYRADSDVIGSFMDDCLRVNPAGGVLMSEVYQEYRNWSASCGYQALSLKNFTRELRRKLEIRHGMHGNVIPGYSVNRSYLASQDFPNSN